MATKTMALVKTLILPLLFITRGTAQNIFIDNVPGYFDLPSCAEVPLSFIVRDMASGCGDDSKTTSYECFCTPSLAKMNGVISAAVTSRCSTDPATAVSAASEALHIFEECCFMKTAGTAALTAATSRPTGHDNMTATSTPTPSAPLLVQTSLAPIPSNAAYQAVKRHVMSWWLFIVVSAVAGLLN
ncbi:hypothetical protein F4779DRAFT_622978 [Xylariaceae sp. FL0662B]|nr:hypothetical protein F4779DRAFT_622978 [Xylariaceae sp. FL0662B]